MLQRFLLGSLLCVSLVSAARSSEPTVAGTLSEAVSSDGMFIHWREHVIDDEAGSGLPLRGADGFELADFDRDGYLDIAVMWEDSSHLRVSYGTEQAGRWQTVTLAQGVEVHEIEDGAVGDVNGDGWLDLLVATEGGSLLYLQNPGEGGREVPWQRVVPTVVQNRGSWIRVYLADLNRDGRLEAIAVNKGVTMPSGKGSMDVAPTAVSWFSIGDKPLDADAWVEHELNRTVIPVNARPVDLDGDGDLDIVGGSRGESRMFWFENMQASPGAALSFREHRLEVTGRNVPQGIPIPKMLSGMDMVFGDLNGDGRLDIVTNETAFSLNWLEQPADILDSWQIHTIGAVYPDVPTGIMLADINGDGLQDVFTGGYSEDPRDHDSPTATRNSRAGRIVWYEQPGKPGEQWVEHNISRRVRGMYDAFAAMDVDRDGLLDVLYTRGNSGEYDGLYWLRQQRSEKPQAVFTSTRDEDSRALPLPDSIMSTVVNWFLE
jgi:hypothetical protein